MDDRRSRAYSLGVSSPETRGAPGGGEQVPPKTMRRRPPNQQEQAKREAWGKFWGNINKGAMTR